MNIQAVQPNYTSTQVQQFKGAKEAQGSRVHTQPQQEEGISLAKVGAGLVLAGAVAYGGYRYMKKPDAAAAEDAGKKVVTEVIDAFESLKKELKPIADDALTADAVKKLDDELTTANTKYTKKFNDLAEDKKTKITNAKTDVETKTSDLKAFTDAEEAVTKAETELDKAVNEIKDEKVKKPLEDALKTVKEGKNSTDDEKTALSAAEKALSDSTEVGDKFKAIATAKAELKGKLTKDGEKTLTAAETKKGLEDAKAKAEEEHLNAIKDADIETEYNAQVTAQKAKDDATTKQTRATAATSLIEEINNTVNGIMDKAAKLLK